MDIWHRVLSLKYSTDIVRNSGLNFFHHENHYSFITGIGL